MDKRSPSAHEDRVHRFEELIGATLPGDYRRFLIACNGGYLGGSLWYTRPGLSGRHAHVGINHIGGFRDESHFSLESARASYQDPEELRIPLELLWIMDDPFGNAFCLGIEGPSRGRVYFWDHEEEPDPDEWDGSVENAGNLLRLADSFEAFVEGLRPLDEVPA
ncbi:MAG: SMI1/KNR4 family protein [Vicinamibacteria bacterium]